MLSQASAGLLSENGLAPVRYVEQRGKRPERWAKVDYEKNRVAFSGNEPVALVEGVQDRLSALVQLGLLARVLPERFAPGASVEIAELSFREVERTRYTSRGAQVLDTEDGPLRALLLERTEPRGERETKVEVWLGYDQDLIPVRIRLTDAGGRVLDQLIAR